MPKSGTRGTFWCVPAPRLSPPVIADAVLAVFGTGLIAIAAWVPVPQTQIEGPSWLRALLPLLIGAPLAVRRWRPLLMWTLMWAGISAQSLVTGTAPVTLALTLVLFAGSYAVAAHSTRRRAVAGLGIMAAGAAIYVVAGHALAGKNGGQPSFGDFAILRSPDTVVCAEILALWLAGLFVRACRQTALLAARNARLDREADRAVAAERARIARELHDIVAHHLSVVILQAAGARASAACACGEPSPATLEKIETSGRQALTETRRLLGLLRGPGESAWLAPQPGIGTLTELADNVRAAGLPVRLVVAGDHAALPATVAVSAYRIVQESLTNVLKHAGPARATVAVGCAADSVTIEVTDDGAGYPLPGAHPGAQGHHGLAGMRERAAMFGGEVRAGPEPGGGFAVRATLPLRGGSA
jgi:signal transduction histidine kinase